MRNKNLELYLIIVNKEKKIQLNRGRQPRLDALYKINRKKKNGPPFDAIYQNPRFQKSSRAVGRNILLEQLFLLLCILSRI